MNARMSETTNPNRQSRITVANTLERSTKMLKRTPIVACAVLGTILIAAAQPAPADLLNKYNNHPSTWVNGGGPGGSNTSFFDAAGSQGDGSTNITTLASANGGAAAGAAGSDTDYGTDRTVDGNFFGWTAAAQGREPGGVRQASGFWGHTDDPDPHIWSAATPGFGAVTINQQYVAYSFNDGPHQFGRMRVWNHNQDNPVQGTSDTDRGVQDMWVWYSNDAALPGITGGAGAADPGAGWTLDGMATLSQAPGTGDYDGETVILGDFVAEHVLFMIDTNYGDAAMVGLSQVQFFVPEPSTAALLAGACLGLVSCLRRRR
jgi:hypothetical protein